MKRALIIGASGGIGSALLRVLASRGYEAIGVSRQGDGLDITNPASVRDIVGRIEGPFDLVVIATGILAESVGAPEKSVAAIEAESMAHVMAVNAIGPALVLQAVLPLMPRDTPSHIGVLSARVGSIGDNRIGGWHSYRASKAALNQIVRGTAIELGRSHKYAVCAALHPGTVETPFTEKYAGRHKTIAPEQAAESLVDVLTALTPDHSGGFYDWQGKEVPW